MTLYNNYQALAGTTNSSFQIGAGGLTIYQGVNPPNTENLSPNNGDLYILIGTTPSIFQFGTSTGWTVNAGGGGGGGITAPYLLVRTKVNVATFTATNAQSYLGVNFAGATIDLPAGTTNKNFTIKDEIGSAYANPITIVPYGSDTIDGRTTATINVNYGSISLIYGDLGWFIF